MGYQELQSSTHAMDEVIVTKMEYEVTYIDEDTGEVHSMDKEGEAGPVLEIDVDPETENEVHKALLKEYTENSDTHTITISVTNCMSKAAIQAFNSKETEE